MLIFPSNDFDKNKITDLFYRAIEIKIKGCFYFINSRNEKLIKTSNKWWINQEKLEVIILIKEEYSLNKVNNGLNLIKYIF